MAELLTTTQGEQTTVSPEKLEAVGNGMGTVAIADTCTTSDGPVRDNEVDALEGLFAAPPVDPVAKFNSAL